MQVQETQKVPIKMNPKRPTPRYIILKYAKFKDKERISKAAREKQLVTYKEAPIRLAADFATETLQKQKHCKPGENGKKYSNNEKQMPATQQGSQLKWKAK